MDTTMAEASSSSSTTTAYLDVRPPLSRHKTAEYLAVEDRYAHIDRILDRRGPWTDEVFVGGQEVRSAVSNRQRRMRLLKLHPTD